MSRSKGKSSNSSYQPTLKRNEETWDANSFKSTLNRKYSPENLWARLVSTHPGYQNFDVFEDEVIFGRRDDADVRIPDQAISGTHCRLWRDKKADEEEDPTHPHHQDIYVEDLSTNGTFIKSQKIGKGNRVKVMTGSEIVLIPKGKNRQKVSFLMYIPSEERLEKAPEGEVTFVFTDVQGSTTLWENEPDAMNESLKRHDRILRKLLREFKGYEVKTEGDAFMVAFFDAISAIKWCLAVQEHLLAAHWPDALLNLEPAKVERDAKGECIFSGIRVRMGIHTGTPNCRRNPVTGRMDYFGPDVNKCARVSDSGHGGQIVCTVPVKEKLDQYLRMDGTLSSPVAVLDCGDHPYKGISENVQVFELRSSRMSERAFPPLRTEKGSGRKEHYHKLIDEEKQAFHHIPAAKNHSNPHDPASDTIPLSIDEEDDLEIVNPAECHYPECTNIETLQNIFGCCASCEQVKYCGPDCQRKDWKRHKQICKKVAQEKKKEKFLKKGDSVDSIDRNISETFRIAE